MTVQPQRQDSTTNVVNLHAERARRRPRESTESLQRVSRESPQSLHRVSRGNREAPSPTLEDAALTLLGISAEAHDFLFLDAADIVAKLDAVYIAIIASLTPEARRRL